MMAKICLTILVALAASRAAAAPIEITVRLVPGGGPSYDWVMTMSVDLLHPIGGTTLGLRGFDSMTVVNPLVYQPDSALSKDVVGDGRDFLILNNSAPGAAIVPAGSIDLPMVILHSAFNSVGAVSIDLSEDVFTGSVYDLWGTPYDNAQVAVRLVPEPGSIAFSGAALLALAALRTARRRVA